MTWEVALYGTLKDVFGALCDIPVQEFRIETPIVGRFIRFIVKSFYGHGGGLQYISWRGPKVQSLESKCQFYE